MPIDKAMDPLPITSSLPMSPASRLRAVVVNQRFLSDASPTLITNPRFPAYTEIPTPSSLQTPTDVPTVRYQSHIVPTPIFRGQPPITSPIQSSQLKSSLTSPLLPFLQEATSITKIGTPYLRSSPSRSPQLRNFPALKVSPLIIHPSTHAGFIQSRPEVSSLGTPNISRRLFSTQVDNTSMSLQPVTIQENKSLHPSLQIVDSKKSTPNISRRLFSTQVVNTSMSLQPVTIQENKTLHPSLQIVDSKKSFLVGSAQVLKSLDTRGIHGTRVKPKHRIKLRVPFNSAMDISSILK